MNFNIILIPVIEIVLFSLLYFEKTESGRKEYDYINLFTACDLPSTRFTFTTKNAIRLELYAARTPDLRTTSLFACTFEVFNNNENIFDPYEALLNFYLADFTPYDETLERYNAIGTWGPNLTKQIQYWCGEDSGCTRSCLKVSTKNPYEWSTTFCTSKNRNLLPFTTKGPVYFEVYLIGGQPYSYDNLTAWLIPFSDFYIDIHVTRAYKGECYDVNKFYCESSGFCIDRAMICGETEEEIYNCPITEYNLKETNETYEDTIRHTSCINPPTPPLPQPDYWPMIREILRGIGYGVLALTCLFVAYQILNHIFYRPGYFIWRVAPLRQLFPNMCTQMVDKFINGTLGKYCPIFRNTTVDGDVFNRTGYGQHYTSHPAPGLGWQKFTSGEGYHLRENR